MSEGFIPIYFYTSMDFGREPTETAFFIDPEIEKAEKIFNKFCEKVVVSDRPDFSKPPDEIMDYPIPPLIHFIWLGSLLPLKAKESIDSWQRHHPGFNIKIWGDLEAKTFPWSKQSSKKAFEEGSTLASKADILRLEILFQHGGIYSDTDVICLKPFHELIIHESTFFGGLELNQVWKDYGKPLYVGTAIMGAAKESDLIGWCINNFEQSVGEGLSSEIVLKGGPGLLSRACSEALNSKSTENLLILPCSYLYPLPYSMRHKNLQEFIAPESMAVHLWQKSWL